MKKAGLPSLFSQKPLREIDRVGIALKGIMRLKSAIQVSAMPVTVYIGDDGDVKTTKDKEIDPKRIIGKYSRKPKVEEFICDIDATREAMGVIT